MLSIILISLIVPIIPFPSSINFFPISENPIQFLNPLDGTALVFINSSKESLWEILKSINNNSYINLNNILLIIYISGLVRFAIIYIRTNLKVVRIIGKSKIINKNRYKIVQTKDSETAFTWFKYIFLSEKYYNLSENEQNQILDHEKVHANRLHTIDIIVIQILETLFWFNPLIKKANHTIKEIHEFIVDYEISKMNNINEYSDLIIKLSLNKYSLQNVNAFSKYPIKNRIQLLAFPLPEKLKKISFLGGIPVMLMIIISYSFTISYINKSTNRLQLFNNQEFTMPIEGNYEIISNFYINQKVEKKINKIEKTKISISHPEISFSVKSFTNVLATKNGIVSNIDTFDNWGVNELIIKITHDKEFSSIYKGLWKSNFKINQRIKKHETIGTTGDNRLYPIFNYQLLKNSKPVDPFIYINY